MKIDFGDITQIIVAIIGLIGIFYSNRKQKIQKRKPIKPQPKAYRKYLILFWISISLTCANLGIFGWRFFLNNSVNIKITYPIDGAKVSINETIRGRSKNIPKNMMIWIIVYSYTSKKYFPNHNPAQIDNNGNWSSPTIIGSTADDGKRFSISAYLIDENIRNKLEAEFNRLDFAGLEILPLNMQLYHRISVYRR